MNPTPAATILDVAERAGVSVSTVSNVLNGREKRMREETLLRVRDAIAELQFRPNQSARRLKTGHMPMLGLLVPSIANPFFGALARWVEAAALEQGYGVLLCNTQRDAEREREYVDAFMAQGVRGVIIGSALQAQEHLEPLVRQGMAVVSFDRTSSDTGTLPIDYVSMDNRRAAAMAVEHLVSLGHRNITYVSAPLRSMNRVARLEGAQRACAKAGVTLNTYLGSSQAAFDEGEMAELGRIAALELCAAGDAATGWVAMNDMVAIGILAGLRDSGRQVPEDVSVIGIDDLFLGRYVSPALTTVRQPLQAMTEAAVESVLARVSGHQDAARQFVFMPELIERESARATTAAAAPAPRTPAPASMRRKLKPRR